MADTVTNARSWRTTGAQNNPKDGSKINPASPASGAYASLGNAIRDIKSVIREESLNLGWDPSASLANNDGTRFIQAVADSPYKPNQLLLPKTWYGQWMRGVEGQQFILRVGQNAAAIESAQVYNYYTGFVCATRAVMSGTDAGGSYVYFTGLRKWVLPTVTDGIHRGLAPVAVDDITDEDYGFIGTAGSPGTNTDIFLDFSAYAPMQNLAYASSTFRLQAATPLALDSNPTSAEACPVPRRTQYGRIRIDKVGKREVCAIFPYPEKDTEYTVTVTPQGVNEPGLLCVSGSFIVREVIKSNSFCIIRFDEAIDSDRSSNWIEFDWEITRKN